MWLSCELYPMLVIARQCIHGYREGAYVVVSMCISFGVSLEGPVHPRGSGLDPGHSANGRRPQSACSFMPGSWAFCQWRRPHFVCLFMAHLGQRARRQTHSQRQERLAACCGALAPISAEERWPRRAELSLAFAAVLQTSEMLSDSKVRYITSLKRGDMGIRGKIH